MKMSQVVTLMREPRNGNPVRNGGPGGNEDVAPVQSAPHTSASARVSAEA